MADPQREPTGQHLNVTIGDRANAGGDVTQQVPRERPSSLGAIAISALLGLGGGGVGGVTWAKHDDLLVKRVDAIETRTTALEQGRTEDRIDRQRIVDKLDELARGVDEINTTLKSSHR